MVVTLFHAERQADRRTGGQADKRIGRQLYNANRHFRNCVRTRLKNSVSRNHSNKLVLGISYWTCVARIVFENLFLPAKSRLVIAGLIQTEF